MLQHLATLDLPVNLRIPNCRMSSGTNPERQEPTETERATIATALSGMTTAQLVELRTAARRLQHLPFSELMTALFEHDAGFGERTDEGGVAGARLREEPFSGYHARASSHSKFMVELFKQIEWVLAAKSAD